MAFDLTKFQKSAPIQVKFHSEFIKIFQVKIGWDFTRVSTVLAPQIKDGVKKSQARSDAKTGIWLQIKSRKSGITEVLKGIVWQINSFLLPGMAFIYLKSTNDNFMSTILETFDIAAATNFRVHFAMTLAKSQCCRPCIMCVQTMINVLGTTIWL